MSSFTNNNKLIGFLGLLLFLASFIAIFYFGYTEYFSSHPSNNVVSSSGFNKMLPAADAQKTMNKLELYIAAEKDSLRKKELLATDPYTKQIESSTVKSDFSLKGFTLRRLQPKKESDIQLRLNNIYQKIAEKPSKKEEPLFNPLSDTVKPASVDPQMKQLENMLDKLIDIQHPEMVRQRIKLDTSSNTNSILNSKNLSFQAVVHQTQVLVSGGTIKLRLLQDLTLKTITIPKGNFLYGVCSISNERLIIDFTHATYLNQVYPVSLKAFDVDGIEGIYIPGAIDREVTKDGADQAIQSFNIGGYETSLGRQAASAGIQTAKTLLSKKVKQIRVTVKAGHHLILQNIQFN